MTKLTEPEDLAMLRHRFGRAIEMSSAYNAFNENEVETGPGKSVINDMVRFQTTHTLLITYYSFIYSLFDPSAVNFIDTYKNIAAQLPSDAREAGRIAIDEWNKIKVPMSIIRSTIGFHHAKKEKSANKGYESYGSIHPYSPKLIMQALRIVFRRASEVYETGEAYAKTPKSQDTEQLMAYVKAIQKAIEETPHQDVMQILREVLEQD
jgi:hypothetical protein